MLNMSIVVHPPNIDTMRAFSRGAIEILPPKPFLDRNRDIVDQSALLIVGPNTKDEQNRSGTWSTFRYCCKKKKLAFLVFPDASLRLVTPSFNKPYESLEVFMRPEEQAALKLIVNGLIPG
jgi:hypothetical protein